jgi:hypothetical protein
VSERPELPPQARLGAVSFVHRFGSSLNEHVLFHCCIIDGVFEPEQGGEQAVRFREAVLRDLAEIKIHILLVYAAVFCVAPRVT